MDNNAVVTLTIGDSYRLIGRRSHFFMQAYAKRINADFRIIAHSDHQLHHFDKFKMGDLLEQYDRIIYFDVDVLVTKQCPNLFKIIDNYEIALLDESALANDGERAEHRRVMEKASKEYDIPLPENYCFFNTGVIVFSKRHKPLFAPPEKVVQMEYGEQPLFNLRLINSDFEVAKLEPSLNRMPYMDKVLKTPRTDANVIHYAGLPDALHQMADDIKKLYPRKRQQPATPVSRLEMLDLLELQDKTCVEIGSYKGDFAWEILRRGPKELWLIDPWASQPVEVWPDDFANADENTMDLMFYDVINKFRHDRRVKIVRDYSVNTAQRFENESLDFVYIDAVHTLESVLIDIGSWWPKVKRGGWLCGHDYTGTFPGVKVAVDAFCKITNKPLSMLCLEVWASWGIQK